MTDYKSRVQFAYADDTVGEDEPGHHGVGTIEIITPRPVDTDEDKYAVSKAIGQKLGKTKVAIQAIIPLETGHVVIDASDYGTDE